MWRSLTVSVERHLAFAHFDRDFARIDVLLVVQPLADILLQALV
jgi:hypothetical protein